MKALTAFGIGLVLGGLILIAASILTPANNEGLRQQPPEGGFAGCVVIFFIPICFGSGTSPQVIQALSLAVFAVFIGLTVFLIYLSRKALRSATYVGP